MADDEAADDGALRGIDATFIAQLQLDFTARANRYGTEASVDIAFLVYLRKMARFGFFAFGPLTIDVRLVEDIVERTISPCLLHGEGEHGYSDDYVRFSRKLVDEVRRSGRTSIDELHMLLAFMQLDEGLPARVFGELGVTPEQVAAYAAKRGTEGATDLPKLYSPEEAADYLGVHVQTVRSWIRSGRLHASRLAGQRSLRIRATDLVSVLEPVEPCEAV